MRIVSRTLACLIFGVLLGLGGCRSVPVSDMQLVSTVLKSEESPGEFRRPLRENVLDLDEEIHIFTTVAWDPAQPSAGRHRVTWKWYSIDEYVTSTEEMVEFDTNPTVLHGTLSSTLVGVGGHRVEILVDGVLISTAHPFVDE